MAVLKTQDKYPGAYKVLCIDGTEYTLGPVGTGGVREIILTIPGSRSLGEDLILTQLRNAAPMHAHSVNGMLKITTAEVISITSA